MQRCSGLLNRRARGSTVATHHFADVAQQRQQQFRKLPGTLPHESANLSIGSISASVVKLLSSSASNGEFAGGSPAGCTNLRACGLTRIAEGPDSESGSLGGASPFMPTISRRLASAGIADPGDLKSPSLPGASPGSPTGVWLIGNSRPVRLKIEQPWECKSPHADQFEIEPVDTKQRWITQHFYK